VFDKNEYQQRVTRLQVRIQQADLDAFVVRTDTNIIYLNGVDYYSAERKVLMVVPAKGEPSLIVPRMEQERLSRSTTVDNVLTYWEMDAKPGRGWQELLHKTLGAYQHIGIEPLADADIVAELQNYDW